MAVRRLLTLVFVFSVVMWPKVNAGAHGPYCEDWSAYEDGLHRLFARWRYLLGTNAGQAAGGKATIVRQPITAEPISGDLNHVDHVFWLHTDSYSAYRAWVEVGIRDMYDSSPVLSTPLHKEGFYWGRLATIGGSQEQWAWWWINSLSLPATGSYVRYKIKWDSAADGYDVFIARSGSDSLHYIDTAKYNNLRPWQLQAGGEANFCDGNDGDSQYNSMAPAYSVDWDWIEPDGTYHAIAVTEAPQSNLPAHMGLMNNNQTACFHMNTSAWC